MKAVGNVILAGVSHVGFVSGLYVPIHGAQRERVSRCTVIRMTVSVGCGTAARQMIHHAPRRL